MFSNHINFQNTSKGLINLMNLSVFEINPNKKVENIYKEEV